MLPGQALSSATTGPEEPSSSAGPSLQGYAPDRMGGSQASLGFMTLAFGSRKYVEMAVDFALSLRQWQPQPVAIAVDSPTAAYLRDHYPAVFDAVIPIPEDWPPGWARKFSVAELTPFDRTVFVDADTLVIGDLEILIADAERSEFAMMGEYLRAPADMLHNGVPIRRLMSQFDLQRYFHNSSCAFTFEREAGRKLLSECLRIWLEELSPTRLAPFTGYGDELSFGLVAARGGMATLSEPYPVYWPDELPDLRPDNGWKPLCNLSTFPSAETLTWLLAEAVARRRRAGQGSLSMRHWLRKPVDGAAARPWLPSLLRDWEVRLGASWRGRQPIEGRAAAESRKGVGREPALGEEPANLLHHRMRRLWPIATPHAALDIRDLRDDGGGKEMPPLSLACHCWPDVPAGLQLTVAWSGTEEGPGLDVSLGGPFDAPGKAIVCLRLRGRAAAALDPAQPVRTNLRVDLLSSGSLQGAVVAIGAGGEYLVSRQLEEPDRQWDCRLALPARLWPAARDEFFLELRIALAGLSRTEPVNRLVLSRIFLGQATGTA